MSMQQQQPQQQRESKELEIVLLLLALIFAWPALLLGVITHVQMRKHTSEPYLYWLGAGIIGALGAFVLVTRENPTPFLQSMINDFTPLVFQMSMLTLKHFALDATPVWERSILVFPWIALIIELLSPKNLQQTLLAQERHRRAIQTRKSKRAAHLAEKAPDQINGKGVLGVLIDNPNE